MKRQPTELSDIRVCDNLTIPATELTEKFTTTGGPGGQHANRTQSMVTLTWHYRSSAAVSDEQMLRLQANLATTAAKGTVRVIAGDSRSQSRNRRTARMRLARLINESLRSREVRIPTKPTATSRRRHAASKRRHGEKKRLRNKPDIE